MKFFRHLFSKDKSECEPLTKRKEAAKHDKNKERWSACLIERSLILIEFLVTTKVCHVQFLNKNKRGIIVFLNKCRVIVAQDEKMNSGILF